MTDENYGAMKDFVEVKKLAMQMGKTIFMEIPSSHQHFVFLPNGSIYIVSDGEASLPEDTFPFPIDAHIHMGGRGSVSAMHIAAHIEVRDLSEQMRIANGENPEDSALDAMLRRFELAVKSALESPPNGINLAEETTKMLLKYTAGESNGTGMLNRAMKRAAARTEKRK
jgi:hypothetical protein